MKFFTIHLRGPLWTQASQKEKEERAIKVYYMKDRTWLLYMYLQVRLIYSKIET